MNAALILFIMFIVVLLILVVLYFTGFIPGTYHHFVKKYKLKKINDVLKKVKNTTDPSVIDRECNSIKEDILKIKDDSSEVFTFSQGMMHLTEATELYVGDNASRKCDYILNPPSNATSNTLSSNATSNTESSNATSNTLSSNATSNTESSNATSNTLSSNATSNTVSTYMIENIHDDGLYERFAPF